MCKSYVHIYIYIYVERERERAGFHLGDIFILIVQYLLVSIPGGHHFKMIKGPGYKEHNFHPRL